MGSGNLPMINDLEFMEPMVWELAHGSSIFYYSVLFLFWRLGGHYWHGNGFTSSPRLAIRVFVAYLQAKTFRIYDNMILAHPFV